MYDVTTTPRKHAHTTGKALVRIVCGATHEDSTLAASLRLLLAACDGGEPTCTDASVYRCVQCVTGTRSCDIADDGHLSGGSTSRIHKA